MRRRNRTAEPRFGPPSILVREIHPAIVGVIESCGGLRLALQMAEPPDFFELRLDRLIDVLDEVENNVAKLRAELIITARHPSEGGAHHLSLKQRQALLHRFLPRAQYVDIELRAVDSLRSLLALTRKKKVRCIISLHDFRSTPALHRLHDKARRAKSCGADIFKVATRTDTSTQLARLLDFFDQEHTKVAISAMGIGKLGAKSRRELMRRGSVLTYAHLGPARISGQPSLLEVRRWALEARHAIASRRRVGR
jgi:3-dehydroquinate dehydratase I